MTCTTCILPSSHFITMATTSTDAKSAIFDFRKMFLPILMCEPGNEAGESAYIWYCAVFDRIDQMSVPELYALGTNVQAVAIKLFANEQAERIARLQEQKQTVQKMVAELGGRVEFAANSDTDAPCHGDVVRTFLELLSKYLSRYDGNPFASLAIYHLVIKFAELIKAIDKVDPTLYDTLIVNLLHIWSLVVNEAENKDWTVVPSESDGTSSAESTPNAPATAPAPAPALADPAEAENFAPTPAPAPTPEPEPVTPAPAPAPCTPDVFEKMVATLERIDQSQQTLVQHVTTFANNIKFVQEQFQEAFMEHILAGGSQTSANKEKEDSVDALVRLSQLHAQLTRHVNKCIYGDQTGIGFSSYVKKLVGLHKSTPIYEENGNMNDFFDRLTCAVGSLASIVSKTNLNHQLCLLEENETRLLLRYFEKDSDNTSA